MNICFVDVESLGLDIERHPMWEVAVIRLEPESEGSSPAWRKTEKVWTIEPNTDEMRNADPGALRINRFYERTGHPDWEWTSEGNGLVFLARDIVYFTDNALMVGVVPHFDLDRIERFCRLNGWPPSWYYQPIDAEVEAVGFLRGRHVDLAPEVGLRPEELESLTTWPVDSQAVLDALEITHIRYGAHEALEDARWAMALYEAVHGKFF